MDIREYIESGILELYAMGALSGDEERQVAEMVARHPELRAELEEISRALESVAEVPGMEPRADLRAKVLEGIPGIPPSVSAPSKDGTAAPANLIPFTPPAAPNVSVRETRSPGRYLLAASLIGFLLASATAVWFGVKLADADSRIAELDKERARVEQEYLRTREALQTVRDYENRVVRMTSSNAPAEQIAVVYWNPNERSVWVDPASLPPLPEDKQYQLWAIADGTPVDAGVFDADAEGLVKMKEIASADAFAVTVEPRGGSAVPTLDELKVQGAL